MEGGSSNNANDISALEDATSNKYSIKNLLFYRAIPNYEVPCATNGHKLFTCKDCGDGFILESSYQNHIARKSVLIKYQCRHCSRRALTFYNRCNLLSHIRSHTVRTATINVSDLSVEPLPLSFFKVNKDAANLVPPIVPTSLQNAFQTVNIQQSDSTSQNDKPSQFENTSQPENDPQRDNEQQPDNTSQLKKTQLFAHTNQSTTPAFCNVNNSTCSDCKKDITSTGILYKDRASHYMRYTNQVYSCPICLFNLPTVCGLRAHLRLHLKIPPFLCPECGMQMTNKSVIYPYTHGCEGFNMMRATARSQCPTKKCNLFHPNNFIKHMTENHFKLIYKCSICVVACFNESTMIKHAKTHNHDICPQRFYQCDLCPGRLVMLSHTDRHIRSHNQIPVYPCWSCNKPFKQAIDFINHHVENHCQYDDVLKNALFYSLNTAEMLPDRPGSSSLPVKKIYRVVKRCEQCLRNFTYKCQFEDINILPNSCPFKCVPTAKLPENNATIECPLCNIKIDQNWQIIKKHFAASHKEHRCLDANIVAHRLNVQKYMTKENMGKKSKLVEGGIKKRTRKARQKKQSNVEERTITNEITCKANGLVCGKCQYECETKEILENHVLSHRDPCMAYQCMECGECFVVKTSFSTHMVLEHAITDIDSYVNEKKCFNENALTRCVEKVVEEPLNENQCKICREQFECPEDLEKHFRVHGMAFLIKNSLNKSYNS